MNKIQAMHFVGIKGVGMAALAIIAKEAGLQVTGSDIAETFITDEQLHKVGITPVVGFAAEHIDGADMVITTGAHGGFDNIEVTTAKAKGIPVFTQGEAVGAFMEGKLLGRSYKGISIAGTHGKTTTTGMVATMLKANDLDPTYVIGTGGIPSLGMPGHYGKGDYFVAEADEYATEPTYDKTPKFLWHHPQVAVFTNIELDHPDVYASVEEMRRAFLQFAKNLPTDGVIIACGDDPQIQLLLHEYQGKVITYGTDVRNDYILQQITTQEGRTRFTFKTAEGNEEAGEVGVIGKHNALNALAAWIVGKQIGLSAAQINQGLQAFTGSRRRSEYIGKLTSGALLYDDYAHHPTEIATTLRGFKEAFPDKKLVCIFQPHTYSRTKKLFEQFIDSLSLADEVVLVTIYASLREKADPTVSSEKLASKLKERKAETTFLPSLPDVVKYVDQKKYSEDTVVLTMGAGDIYRISESLSLQQ